MNETTVGREVRDKIYVKFCGGRDFSSVRSRCEQQTHIQIQTHTDDRQTRTYIHTPPFPGDKYGGLNRSFFLCTARGVQRVKTSLYTRSVPDPHRVPLQIRILSSIFPSRSERIGIANRPFLFSLHARKTAATVLA